MSRKPCSNWWKAPRHGDPDEMIVKNGRTFRLPSEEIRALPLKHRRKLDNVGGTMYLTAEECEKLGLH